jgi:hypothetical protein
MTEQPDENTIARLLEDLQGSEGPRRKVPAASVDLRHNKYCYLRVDKGCRPKV